MMSENDYNNVTEYKIACEPELNAVTHDLDTRQESEKEFILRFEKHPELWNPMNPRYTNKYVRKKGLLDLLPILKKSKPFATLHDVRRKINSIRSNYRRELRKIRRSMESGEEYVAKVWSYPYLSFLGNLDKSNVDNGEVTYLEEIKSPCSDETSEDFPSSDVSTPSIPKLAEARPQESIRPKIKIEKPVHEPTASDPLDESQYTFASCSRTYPPIIQEWAQTLETLDPVQRIYAKKAINDILFEAELGNLRKDSVKIN